MLCLNRYTHTHINLQYRKAIESQEHQKWWLTILCIITFSHWVHPLQCSNKRNWDLIILLLFRYYVSSSLPVQASTIIHVDDIYQPIKLYFALFLVNFANDIYVLVDLCNKYQICVNIYTVYRPILNILQLVFLSKI